MARTFKGGIHPRGRKELSQDVAISTMPLPQTAYIPLSQHIGKPAKAVVAVGQKVDKGQLIAAADGTVSSNIFSSISGTVKEITVMATANGKAEHIVVENDGENRIFRLPPIENGTSEQILARLGEAGIVGLGGAGFPTTVKMATTAPIDTLIINGAECEPYITCDYRVMLDYTSLFIEGVRILKTALGLDKAHIAVEDNKQKAIDELNDYLTKSAITDVEVVSLKTKYPQGGEKQLIYAVTGRKVPLGGLPSAVGCVVANVHTALSAYYAVVEGKTLYKRVMTVTGEGINQPKNLWVSNGTPYSEIIAYCGGLKEDRPVVKMLNGGPMMGTAVASDKVCTTKTTSCLLLLSDSEAFTGNPGHCINCGRCAAACPMRLMPMYIDAYTRANDLDIAIKYGLNACIECGSCSYVCPAKRPLVQSFRLAKKNARGGKK